MYVVFVVIALLLITYILIETNSLEVKKYTITNSKLPEYFYGKKILQIGDLHGKSFGKKNEKLLKFIDGQYPDVIFLTGDIIDGDKKDYSNALELLKYICGKYKVYYIIGNHEQKSLIKKYRENYKKYFSEIKKLNFVELNNKKVYLDEYFNVTDMYNSQKNIALYGLTLPYDSYRYLFSNKDARSINSEYIDEYLGECKNDEVSFLLAHNPLYFDEYAKWGADVIFSGHVHGGIIRIPFVGGLLSPDRTFFPKYSLGRYIKGNTQMYVTKGLGGSAVLVRINCKPEIVLYTLN